MGAEDASARVLDVPPEHVVRSSVGAHWHGLDAAEIVHPLDDFAVPALPRHVLVFNLGAPMAATEQRSGLAGAPRDWHLERCGEVRHLHLYLDPGLIAGVAAEAGLNPDRAELVGAFGIRDPWLGRAGLTLLAGLGAGDPLGRLQAEALATVLAVHLLRHHSALDRPTLRGPATLPPIVLRRALDYGEAHLAGELSLVALARAAGYSPYHFARLFRAATGTSPHRYVIRRRVERARGLLATTGWSVAFIAQEVGFASASHLARHVRDLLGVPPAALRRAARPGERSRGASAHD